MKLNRAIAYLRANSSLYSVTETNRYLTELWQVHSVSCEMVKRVNNLIKDKLNTQHFSELGVEVVLSGYAPNRFKWKYNFL